MLSCCHGLELLYLVRQEFCSAKRRDIYRHKRRKDLSPSTTPMYSGIQSCFVCIILCDLGSYVISALMGVKRTMSYLSS